MISAACHSMTQTAQKSSMPLKTRLNKAIVDFSSQLLGTIKSGALVQVWMPEQCSDGTVVLSAQGLPFAVVGVGDLLALFRCVSVRYRFSTDITRPSLMGAIGRVFATMEPEMSHDVQKYDKQVYLRVSEAQRCRVHSALMVPIFEQDCTDKPLAVLELVQSEKDVVFPAIMSWLTECLQTVSLTTVSLDHQPGASGLRQWPMHVDHGLTKDKGAGKAAMQAAGAAEAAQLTAPHKVEDVNEAVSEMSGEKGMDKQLGSGSANQSSLKLERLSRGSQSAGNSDNPAGSSKLDITGAVSSSQESKDKNSQVMQLMAMISTNQLAPNVLESLRALIGDASGSGQSQQPQQQGSGSADMVTSKPNLAALGGSNTSLATLAPPPPPAAAAPSAAPTTQPGSQRAAGKAARGGGGDGEEQEEDDISTDAEEEDSDDDGTGNKSNNRVGGGAGKRLRFEELQAQFGLGLKEAAANLGICATTLKRACRRHGIKRWPRRQIVKLSKALNQMGYQGMPPATLVQSAVTGQIGSKDAAVVAAASTMAASSAAQKQQLAALLSNGGATSKQPPAQQQPSSATAQPPQPPPPAAAPAAQQQQQQPAQLHPALLAAFPGEQQANQPPPAQQQQPMQPMMSHMGMGMGMMMPGQHMQPGHGMMQPNMGMMQGMMVPMGNGSMGMMPPGMMQAPGSMMQHSMQQAAYMQHQQMQAAMQARQQQQQPQQHMSQQQQQQPGTPQTGTHSSMMPMENINLGNQSSFAPMHFLYGGQTNSSSNRALVNELLPDNGVLPMDCPSSLMQTSSTADQMGGGKAPMPCGFTTNNMACSSSFSIPTGELLHGLDGLGGGDHGHQGVPGLNSQAQMAAIHELFKNQGTGSLENFMELLSDDLPVIQ